MLGFIGPEDIENLEAASMITSPLRLPHITRTATELPHVYYPSPLQKISLIRVCSKKLHDLANSFPNIDLIYLLRFNFVTPTCVILHFPRKVR